MLLSRALKDKGAFQEAWRPGDSEAQEADRRAGGQILQYCTSFLREKGATSSPQNVRRRSGMIDFLLSRLQWQPLTAFDKSKKDCAFLRQPVPASYLSRPPGFRGSNPPKPAQVFSRTKHTIYVVHKHTIHTKSQQTILAYIYKLLGKGAVFTRSVRTPSLTDRGTCGSGPGLDAFCCRHCASAVILRCKGVCNSYESTKGHEATPASKKHEQWSFALSFSLICDFRSYLCPRKCVAVLWTLSGIFDTLVYFDSVHMLGAF